MTDNVSKHPKASEKQGKDAAKEFAAMMRQARRRSLGRKRFNILRVTGYSILLLITTASISGAVWAVVSLIRFLWGAA